MFDSTQNLQNSESKLAKHANSLNMTLLILVLVSLVVIAGIIIARINNVNARNIVRSFSLETAEKFYAYISHDLALVQKAAYSKAITEWCNDEDDITKKTYAFYEMMDQTAVNKSVQMSVCMNESRNEYSVEGKIAFENFVPFAKFERDVSADAWFFDIINAENDYCLNVAVDRPTNNWRLWIDHKVFFEENVVGIFCSGLEIPDIFRQVFGDHDEQAIHGYIIDKQGIIRLGSAGNGIVSDERDIDIRDIIEDPGFTETLFTYLGNNRNYFDNTSQTVIAKLARGSYKYASISPISGSDWSVIVFYSYPFLSGIANLVPVVIAMLAAFILYVVSRNAMMNRLIYVPLSLMTRNIAKGNYHDGIFTGTRDDEIGVLAHTIRDTALERQYQAQVLNAVNSAAAVLLAPMNEEDFEASLLEGMEQIGRCVGVDRINIWQNKMVDGDHCFALQHEWIDGAMRNGKSLPRDTMFHYSDHPEWEEKFSRGEYITGPISSLSLSDKNFLVPYLVKSILTVPVHLEERFWGFVNFVDCQRERSFTTEEISILRSGSLMMASALSHNIHAVQLREAQQNTQVLLDAMPLTIQLWNRKAQMFDCTEETVRFFGVNDKQELIDRFFECSPEFQSDGRDSKEKALNYLDQAFDEGKCVFEWLHQTIDGRPLPVEMTLVRVRYGDEYVVASYARDLREHKRMMEEIIRRDNILNVLNKVSAILLEPYIEKFESNLFHSMGMMAKAVEANRVYIFRNYRKNGKLFCSQMYEWSEDAASQQNNRYTADVSYEDSLPGWEEILSNGRCINSFVSDLSPMEQSILTPQGILSILVVPVFVRDGFWGFVGFDDCRKRRTFSPNEELILRSGSLLITNALLRNDMEMSIRDGAAKLQAVIENYPGIIWCVDKNNIVTLFNGLYLQILNITSKAFEGKKLEEVTQDRRFRDIGICIEKTFAGGILDINTEIDDRIFRIRTTPIYDHSGNVINVVGSFDDITERTRLQAELKEAMIAAQDASTAKTDFLASMSHEMRTPLNAIIGLSELSLGIESLDIEISSNLEKIYNAGMTLLSTVNDILDISKIEAGKFQLNPVAYDMPSLLNDTITQSVLHIGEKDIQFVLDIDENLPARLFGDDLRIKQSLNNLLSNAFKYTRNGMVRLGIQSRLSGNSVRLIFRVEDTGIGIRKTDLESLFSNYVRMDVKSNRDIKGTGLGLPITKRLVEMMNGSISVESEYGKGSVFTIEILQSAVSDTVIGPDVANSLKNFQYSDEKRKSNSRRSRISLPYARVLVVDDMVTNLDVAKGMMKPYGMQIDCVLSGQEAIDAIRDEKVTYSAVFMDHMMPGMDGIEATRIIREEIGTEYAKTIPIIALTANAIIGNEEMFLNNGFQAFISKPIEIERLDSVIREWVRDKEQEKNIPKVMVDGQQFSDIRSGGDRRRIPDRRAGSDRRVIDNQIPGLDTEMGLERFGGDEESYRQVLRSYMVNTRPLLESARNVHEGNLADYAIIVHGIKGSSKGIAANDVGARAEALEMAAKGGNFAFVSANNPGFLDAAGKLIEDLEGMFSEAAARVSRPKKDKPDVDILRRILKGSETYNMDEVDKAMEEIESFEYESDDGLAAWLRENVDQMNFLQIKERLGTLLK